MTMIQFEIPEDLAKNVAPYRERWSEFFELGLRVWQRKAQNNSATELDDVLIQLSEENKLILPRSTSSSTSTVSKRLRPIQIPGKSMGEVVSEQRGR